MSIICDFWYALIVHRFNSNIDPNIPLGNLFFSVISAILKFTIFSNDIFIKLNQGEYDAIKSNHSFSTTEEYRNHIKDFLQDASEYLGFTEIYQNLILPELQTSFAAIKNDPNNITMWAYFESTIFILCCICKNIRKQENFEFLNDLINTLIQIPDNLQKIKMTFIDLIDQLSSYLKMK